ncbi:hypothetical protein Tco_0924712 [Tanacetum coccineum]|uniref:Reverse transcriptase domain-containing protein n=1 Tax=Tanacetum coccineum TaxID=301880 RepID=A0ABQ5D6U2_9ASTR
MDDEPMWAADRVVAPTLSPTITIHETANEFAIKGNHLTLVKGNQYDGRIRTDPHKHIHKFISANNQKPKQSLKKTIDVADEGINNSDTDKIMARIDAMTLNMDAQYKEMKSHNECNRCGGNHSIADFNDDDTPIDDEEEESTPQPKSQTPKPVKETPIPKLYRSKIPYPQRLRKEKMEAQYGKFLDMIQAVRINVSFVDVLAGMPNYGKFLKELVSNKHKLEQISSAFLSDESSAMIQNKVSPKLGDPGSFCHTPPGRNTRRNIMDIITTQWYQQ